MLITNVQDATKRKGADVLVLPFWKGDKEPIAACSGTSDASLFSAPLQAGDFKGKKGETLVVYATDPKAKERRLLLVGLGEKREDVEAVRRSFAAALKVAREKKCLRANIELPVGDPSLSRAACEGVLLANYAFDKLKAESLKEEPTALLKEVCFIGADAKMLTRFQREQTISEGVFLARNLANDNADNATPQELAKQAQKLSKTFPKIKTTVFGKAEIEKLKMGLLLAVNQGSSRDPAFIVMEYRGNPQSKEKTAIVGKGITFDTGGLNLKVAANIETMKLDMSGAAAVLGTMYAAAALKLKVNLVGVVPTTENAIGPKSYKPGDVFTSYLGKTVEINNTDAEGRLILADALSYTVKVLNPTRMIDLATLTGSIVIALGEDLTGMFCNDETLAQAILKAGEETGELVWRMPLYADYKEELKSPIADMKNCGSRKGGSITAALFLQEFVLKTPWAHLDIAGTAHKEPKHYNTTHATGVGVRLLIALLEQGIQKGVFVTPS